MIGIPEHIWQLIVDERKYQEKKYGKQNHEPLKWLAILMEEVGEASKEVLECQMPNYVEEMVQVAAVAVAALETILTKGQEQDKE